MGQQDMKRLPAQGLWKFDAAIKIKKIKTKEDILTRD